MKTLAATLMLSFASLALWAFPGGSQLTVELVDIRPNALIVINGQTFSSMHNVVRLDGLEPGRYTIEVLRPTRWAHQGVIFQGTVRVPHRSSVAAIISPRGMKVDTAPLAHHGGSYWDAPGHGPHHMPNPNGNGGFVSLDPVPEPIVCAPVLVGMHPDRFAAALSSIERATFDTDQVRLAKQIIRNNTLSSQQVAQIMQVFSFESSRLEIAKFAYPYVADPENYFVVNDQFWFSSSIRELDRFINRY